MMESTLHDIRVAFRLMRKELRVTLAAVITLALGIGASTAMLSVVNAFVFRPLPYRNPEKLIAVHSTNARSQGSIGAISLADFEDLRDHNHVFDHMAAFTETEFNLSGAGDPERVQGALVSAEVFGLLGVAPKLGRSFTRNDDMPAAARILVLSDQLWRRRFGSRADIAGQPVRIDGESFAVAGVMPAGFNFPEFSDLWIPIASQPSRQSAARSGRDYEVIARLKNGITLAQAQAEMDTIANQLAQSYRATNDGIGVLALSCQEEAAAEASAALPLLLAAVGFVLLIACANVANLLLARAASRQKEIAVRIAVGASRSRLIRQLLTESVLLSLIGACGEICLALWATHLMRVLIPVQVPFYVRFDLDARVLLATVIISLVTGIAFGLVPALRATRSREGQLWRA